MKPTHTLLAAAMALASTPVFAQPYTQTVFFGDSLTDSGHFRPALGPAGAALGRFTTNPGLVWAEYLAGFYGTNAVSDNQGGSNYSVGGALTDSNTGSVLGPIPAMTTQLTSYLAKTGGRADANALYTVWGGANDLFVAAANPGQAQAIVGAAVAAQAGIISTLQGAGARYVLVSTAPDLGLTPLYRAQGAVASATATQLAATYNSSLFGGLAATGLSVIPLDNFHLLQEVVSNPAPYGITNVTGTACQPQLTAQSLTCNPATYVDPTAPDTYAFADGVHPSSKTHAIIGDYAISILEAPRQLAMLPHSAAMVGSARADRVATQIEERVQGEGMRWWIDGLSGTQRNDEAGEYDGASPTLTLGVDWASGSLVYGGFAGYGMQTIDWGHRRGNFNQSDATLGGYSKPCKAPHHIVPTRTPEPQQ